MTRSAFGTVLAAAGMVLASAADPAAARDERVDELVSELPELARVEAGPVSFVLRGRLSDKKRKNAERVARGVVADLRRRLSLEPASGTPAVIDVCLFASATSYAAFDLALYAPGRGPSRLGYYAPAHRVVVADLTRGMGNLRHELVHPMLGHDFAALPSWLNEGFGSLYGSARATRRDAYHFLVNYRLRDLHRALAASSLPSLEELTESSRAEVYGDDSMVYYAFARYVLLYMDRRGTLADFYTDVRAARGDPRRVQLALLERVDYGEFKDWARGLRYPPRLRPR